MDSNRFTAEQFDAVAAYLLKHCFLDAQDAVRACIATARDAFVQDIIQETKEREELARLIAKYGVPE